MEPERPHNVFASQPVLCPWTSRAPISNRKPPLHPKSPLEPPPTLPSPHQPCNNNRPSVQQSSTEFFHFLRLMQLFPDVHPATLHTVLSLCKNDFFCAVDKLLYAKRCKELCNGRRNLLHRYSQTRYQPYACCNLEDPNRAKSLKKQHVEDVSVGKTASSSECLCAGQMVVNGEGSDGGSITVKADESQSISPDCC